MSSTDALAFVKLAMQFVGGEICFSNSKYEVRGPIAKVEQISDPYGEYLQVTCEWLARHFPISNTWRLRKYDTLVVPLDGDLVIDKTAVLAATQGSTWSSMICYTLSLNSPDCLKRSQIF